MAGPNATKRAHNFKDLTGQRFGRLTSIAQVSKGRDGRWLCRCDCGIEKLIRGRHLRDGAVTSCGCYRDELLSARGTHWATRTKEWNAWSNAKTRCFNKNCVTYPIYGGRGITMCDGWRNSFEQFIADMGPCPPKMSLDRIDGDGNYTKENCRWITHLEQVHNFRRQVIVEYNGETRPLWEWSEISGVRLKVLYGRYHRGTAILGPRTRRWQKRPES